MKHFVNVLLHENVKSQ